jgi:hypothetical protein
MTTTEIIASLKASYDAVLANQKTIQLGGQNTKYLDTAAPMLAAAINRLTSHIYWVETHAPAPIPVVQGTATVPVAPTGVPPVVPAPAAPTSPASTTSPAK